MANRNLSIEDRGDYICVGLEGDEVWRVYVDYQFSLLCGKTGALIVIEQPFFIIQPSATWKFSPVEWDHLGPALQALLFKTVRSCKAFKNGQLEVVFQEGLQLRVEPHADYEAWHVTSEAGAGAGGVYIVAMPGGKLGIWGPADSGDQHQA